MPYHINNMFPFLVFISVSLCSHAQKIPKGVILRVVIIRHGEKPDSGNNLSCAGLNRALALPAVLDTVIRTPDYTYVPTIGTGDKKTSSVRMFQTVTPFAVKNNLTVNSKYEESDTTGVAKDVKKKTGIILIVWEHKNIPGLARNLGVKGSPSWPGSDFDSIWIIDFKGPDINGKTSDPLLTIEKENIHPSNTCPTK